MQLRNVFERQQHQQSITNCRIALLTRRILNQRVDDYENAFGASEASREGNCHNNRKMTQ